MNPPAHSASLASSAAGGGGAVMVTRHRGMITLTVMTAAIMQNLDTTIANVALPRMQGSLSGTQDQITWVVTSYVVAAAIMIPLTGWLAERYGRKPLLLVSIIGFTLSSALCGMAQSLGQLVLFRIMQGALGAALLPMPQAVMFDLYPREQIARAMGIFSSGVILSPMLGPLLGGWLTDSYSWRWVFYVNVPFGTLAALGVLAYFPDTRHARKHFDFFGFAMLSVFIGALQLLLDRGPSKDWFNSGEIKLEAAVAGLACYLFITHTLTTPLPFVRLALFKDRNFVAGSVMFFLFGCVMSAALSLMPLLLQDLMGYSVFQSGMATSPRAAGTLIAMFLGTRLVHRVDARVMIGIGVALTAAALWKMTGFTMLMGMSPVVWAGLLQGLGSGLVMVSIMMLAFRTLPISMRNEGTAMFSLTRNFGTSVGISVVQGLFVRNVQVVHASLVSHLTPFTVATHSLGGHVDRFSLAMLDRSVTAQASMIAYLDDFHLMLLLSLATLPFLLMIRNARTDGNEVTDVVLE